MVSDYPIVDLIARAAAVMRERAEQANTDEARRPYSDRRCDPVPETGWGALVDNYLGGEIGQHCAAWTPAAALAVAVWLESGANEYACVDRAPMAAVARAYLGEPEPESVAGLLEPGQLYLIADAQGVAHIYRVGDDLRPRELDLADSRRHGRGALGHGYTTACDPTAEQCNNSQCRAGLNHPRCNRTCTGETYWDDLGPWQVAPARRDALLEALAQAARVDGTPVGDPDA